MITSYDLQISKEPDFGYNKWCDQVWEIVSKSDRISGDDINTYWDKFFEPLTLKLSQTGTLPSGGCQPSFAAEVIISRWLLLNRDFPFLLEILKS